MSFEMTRVLHQPNCVQATPDCALWAVRIAQFSIAEPLRGRIP
jgi:hypothetical protein